MTWTAIFEPYSGNTTVGTATLTWNAGLPDQFVFVLPVNTESPDDITALAKQALSARDSASALAVDAAKQKTSIETLLISVLNGDPAAIDAAVSGAIPVKVKP